MERSGDEQAGDVDGPRGRRFGTIWWTALSGVLALAVVGGLLAASGVLDRDDGPGCDRLLEDRHIQEVLDLPDDPGTDCAALGEQLRVALVGDTPGWHGPGQRAALEATVRAVGSEIRERREIRMHPDLRQPIADALVSYRHDLSALLRFDYRFEDFDLPLEDGKVLAHVPKEDVFLTMQAASEDPEAHATLRSAFTLRCAEEFAAVEEDTVRAAAAADEEAEESLYLAARGCGSVIGWLDAARAGTVERLGADSPAAEDWERAVRRHASGAAEARTGPPPAYEESPAAHITETWRQRVLDGGDSGRGIEEQPCAVVVVWVEATGVREVPGATVGLCLAALEEAEQSLPKAAHAARCAREECDA